MYVVSCLAVVTPNGTQVPNLLSHARCEFRVRVLLKLTVRELNRIFILGKKGEKERKAGMSEELFLGNFAVFVHRLSHHCEVLHQVGEERIILVVTM